MINGVVFLLEEDGGFCLYLFIENGIIEVVYCFFIVEFLVIGVKQFIYCVGCIGIMLIVFFGSDGIEWLLMIDVKCVVLDVFIGMIGCEGG